MKILHTADWHIGQFKGPVVDGVNLRSQDTIKCLEYMVEVAQKEKPGIVSACRNRNAVYFAGRIFFTTCRSKMWNIRKSFY